MVQSILMSTYGNFFYQIEGKFVDQPDEWCISFIGRRYEWDDKSIEGLYLMSSFEPYGITGYGSWDYCYKLDLKQACEHLDKLYDENPDDYKNCYTSSVKFLYGLSQQGLDVEVFYRNEYYYCEGMMGCDATDRWLKEGRVKKYERR